MNDYEISFFSLRLAKIIIYYKPYFQNNFKSFVLCRKIEISNF